MKEEADGNAVAEAESFLQPQNRLVRLRPTAQEEDLTIDNWSVFDVRTVVKHLYYFDLPTKKFAKVRTKTSVAAVARMFQTTEYKIKQLVVDYFTL